VGHDEAVPNQQSRDQKTVAIATALGFFVLVLAAGSAVLWATTSALDVSDRSSEPAFTLLVAAAATMAVGYLVRTGKRRHSSPAARSAALVRASLSSRR
jgi:hypothetical protein